MSFSGVSSPLVSFAGVESNFDDFEKDFTGVTWMLSDTVEETSFFVEDNCLIGVAGGREDSGPAREPPDVNSFGGRADLTGKSIHFIADVSFSEERSNCFETGRTLAGQTATGCTWLVFTASLLKVRFENPLLKDGGKWEGGTGC